jgi:hypothetical protein
MIRECEFINGSKKLRKKGIAFDDASRARTRVFGRDRA